MKEEELLSWDFYFDT